jgi:hypothetical protein
MGRYTRTPPLSNISSWTDAYAIPDVILREELLKQLLIPCGLLKRSEEREWAQHFSLRKIALMCT